MHAAPAPVAVKVIGAALAASSLGAGVWALRTFDPNVQGNPFLPCLFNLFTGLFCPGCGATRALHALVHFDLPGALSMNPLLVLLLPTMPALVAWSKGWRPRVLAPVLAPVMRVVGQPALWLVLIPAYWIARNLPWAPLSWMAPG